MTFSCLFCCLESSMAFVRHVMKKFTMSLCISMWTVCISYTEASCHFFKNRFFFFLRLLFISRVLSCSFLCLLNVYLLNSKSNAVLLNFRWGKFKSSAVESYEAFCALLCLVEHFGRGGQKWKEEKRFPAIP